MELGFCRQVFTVPFFQPFARRIAESGAEQSVEMGEVAVAAGKRRSDDRVVVVFEEVGCVGQTEFGEMGEKRAAELGSEQLAEMPTRHAGPGARAIEAPWLVKGFGDFARDIGDATFGQIGGCIDRRSGEGHEDIFGGGAQGDFAAGLTPGLFDDAGPPECLETRSPGTAWAHPRGVGAGELRPESFQIGIAIEKSRGETEQEERGRFGISHLMARARIDAQSGTRRGAQGFGMPGFG